MVVTLRKRPCSSCPYRADAPSGVWHEDEYRQLEKYDGEIAEQAIRGAVGLFHCHNTPASLCAGWLATHGPDNLLALRLQGNRVDPAVWDYETDVACFASGAEASEHGRRDIEHPTPEAVAATMKILAVRPDVEWG